MPSQTRGDAARFGAGHKLGPYCIEAFIGAGGMGEIYKARDERLDRTVAIKVLRRGSPVAPAALERFRREARLIARLSHPHICTVYDVGEAGDTTYLVMEFLAGETLAAQLRNGPLSIEVALRHAIDIGDAVAAMHQHGIIHRDLKPSNIMITRAGAKLLDFGIAKVQATADSPTITERITEDGAMVGTLRYMAPELLSGRDADARSDVFAFGCVLYEMTTGVPAFTGVTPVATLNSLVNDHPAPITTRRPDAPPALDQIVDSCLAKEQEDRWRDISDAIRPLKWIAEGHLHTPLPGSALPVARRARRSLIRVATAAAVVGAIATAGVMWPRSAVAPPRFPNLTAVPCAGPDDAIDAVMLCNGLLEELTRRLSRLSLTKPIQVTTLGESVRRGVRTVDASRASIGASLVLTGTVRREGEDLAVEYRLADTAKVAPVNREPFVLPAAALFANQDRAVAWLVRLLALDLDHMERDGMTALPTRQAEAYHNYLLGLGILRAARRDAASLHRVMTALSAATTADASFAGAHALLGFAAWAQFEQTRDPRWQNDATAACDRAVALHPDLAEGHACRGNVQHFTGQHAAAAASLKAAVDADRTYDDAIVWLGREFDDQRKFDAAEATYRDAVASRPGYWAAHGWLGNFMRRQARYEEAVASYERVVALVPAAARAYAVLAMPLTYLGRYEDAIRSFEQATTIEPTVEAYSNWGVTLFRMRKFDEASRMFLRARELGATRHLDLANAARIDHYAGRRQESAARYRQAIAAAESELLAPGRKSDLHVALAEYYAKLGDVASAVQHLREVGIDPHTPIRPSDPHILFNVAMIYNQIGNRDAALAWLERAVYWGVPAAELSAFPELDDLRSHPAFQSLLRQSKSSRSKELT